MQKQANQLEEQIHIIDSSKKYEAGNCKNYKAGDVCIPPHDGRGPSEQRAFIPEGDNLETILSSEDNRFNMLISSELHYLVNVRLTITFNNSELISYNFSDCYNSSNCSDYTKSIIKTNGFGSGTLIGPHHVLTAAHNIFHKDYIRVDNSNTKLKTGWANDITLELAFNNNINPYKTLKATRVYFFKQWVESNDPEYDIALIILDQSIGIETGWAGLMALDDDALEEMKKNNKINITGYPGTHKGNMMSINGKIDNFNNNFIGYKLDTSYGQSGCSIYIKHLGKSSLIGVHTTGGQECNKGVRLTESKLEKIVQWIFETYKLSPPPKISFKRKISSFFHELVSNKKKDGI